MNRPRDHAVRSSLGSCQAPERRPHRRPGPGRRALDAEGDGLQGRGSRQADRRSRHDLDRDDAVQPEPAGPRGSCQARRAGCGRHADGVQHRRRVGRRLDGNIRHACLPRLAGGDRRFDRARRSRAPLRRARAAGRLRQDEPGRSHGGRAARYPRGPLLLGLDRPGLYRQREVSVADVYEGIGAYAAGKISAEDLHELESAACPGAGACGGQFTANTMSTILDFLGLSPFGANGIPAVTVTRSRLRTRQGGWPSVSSGTTSPPARS